MRKTLLTFVFFLACHASGDAVEVRLRSSAEVAGSIVRLADVAEIVADEADPQSAALANLALVPAPDKARPLALGRLEIEQLLRLSGVEMREVTLSGAETVEVRAGGTAERTIIRPALHLIPAAQFVRPASATVAVPLPIKPVPPPELVRRNSSVTVHSRASGVRVTTSGKALSGGIQGANITVELDESHEKVQARVVGPQMVQVAK